MNSGGGGGGGVVHYTQAKDTATLWVRCREVEMAERFGQKLQEKKWNSDFIRNAVKREQIKLNLRETQLSSESGENVKKKKKQNKLDFSHQQSCDRNLKGIKGKNACIIL